MLKRLSRFFRGTDSKDLYERLWTGREIKVCVGESLGEHILLTSQDRKFVSQALPLLSEFGYNGNLYVRGAYFREITLQTIRLQGIGEKYPGSHEMDLCVDTAEGSLRMGVEFEAINRRTGSYYLRMFFKNHEGCRFVFQERPPQEMLKNTYGLFYRLLQRTGHLLEKRKIKTTTPSL